MQLKYDTEPEARHDARNLRDNFCQIVESWPAGSDAPSTFYLESGDDVAMIRPGERLVFQGPGRKA